MSGGRPVHPPPLGRPLLLRPRPEHQHLRLLATAARPDQEDVHGEDLLRQRAGTESHSAEGVRFMYRECTPHPMRYVSMCNDEKKLLVQRLPR